MFPIEIRKLLQTGFRNQKRTHIPSSEISKFQQKFYMLIGEYPFVSMEIGEVSFLCPNFIPSVRILFWTVPMKFFINPRDGHFGFLL